MPTRRQGRSSPTPATVQGPVGDRSYKAHPTPRDDGAALLIASAHGPGLPLASRVRGGSPSVPRVTIDLQDFGAPPVLTSDGRVCPSGRYVKLRTYDPVGARNAGQPDF
ncbi:hypothetical protein [Streptomyces lavendulae]|uniref:hypothetical protein n=1 Tax=Streptomyces lavendulae TaxID=1914 RepID=UPI0031E8BD27